MWWLRAGSVEYFDILTLDGSAFRCVFIVHGIPSLLGLMAAYLLISFPHRCAIQVVGSFQNGVLAELLL